MLFGRGVGSARGGEEGRQREEVARPRGAVGDEGEDLGDEALLYTCVQLCVEFSQPWLALAVEDQEGVDHIWNGALYVCMTRMNTTTDWAAGWWMRIGEVEVWIRDGHRNGS